MHSMDIRLKEQADVATFVNITNDYPFQILLRQGRALVDGKSLLGIYSLNLAFPITVEAYAEQTGQLLTSLARFET